MPIGLQKKQEKHLAVSGYSCLSNLVKTDATKYREFLEQPCENAAQELAAIPANEDIEELLALFRKTNFGFVLVEGKFELCAVASLRDLLLLYKNGIMDTSLSLDEIASPVFYMSQDSSLKQVLTEMFSRGFRRIFLEEENEDRVITDRKITSHVFSPSTLDEIVNRQIDPLETLASKLEATQPMKLPGMTTVKDGASMMRGQIEECLVCENGVVTPWDVVMKPWMMKKATFKQKSLNSASIMET